MSHYRAVLFDWIGTLVHERQTPWRLRRAHKHLGRPIDEDVIRSLATSLDESYKDPVVRALMRTEDCSPEQHRVANMLWFERAGIHVDLAGVLYAMDSDPATHPPYPDAADVLADLRSKGIRVAVVSDFHLDIRPEIAEHDFAANVDAVVVSSELGFQKPDVRMFKTALELLDVEARDALMVGDRASRDGAATSVGIAALILPMPDKIQRRGLDAVLRLVG